MKRRLILLYWKFFKKQKYELYMIRMTYKTMINELKRAHKKYSSIERSYRLVVAESELNFKNWRA